MKKIIIDARESGTSTGRYVDKLIENLAKIQTDYEFVIITKARRVDFFNQISNKLKVVKSPYKEFTFAEQLGLKRQIEKISPDLVHFTMTQQPILYRGKTITTIHDLTTARFRNPAKNPLIFSIKQFVYRRVVGLVARKSGAIITPTEFVKDDVARFARINSRKISVTYEAADKITEPAEPVADLLDSEFIMYVGRPQPHKNLYRLVTAFSKLKKSQPKLKLVLVGKKDVLYDRLERWVNDQAIKDVVFTGFIDESRLGWLYENCQAYVFPSLSEGFGLPPLEAMTHGAPVISSNATCLPEVEGQAAYYFDPYDVEDMAAKINEVLTNKSLRSSLVRKGFEQAEKYSWKRMAQQTLDVYDGLLEDTTSR